ncbi:hypothetical protein [Cytobacillus firmus]|uniref:Uncharacterized protein n=1 Tax=Cytobacillus firmus DS1 TaxID=1307436 RepID=W7L9Y4_CYTFI|nr:hypothetical protein [Cytobacillus firmus]EWG12031.1 hypothetical protein PBF_04528 [Cytobacillus firmus DS1]MBG9654492.1 hypothetical protein [Cytobacillus firmus]MED1905693.1 hypothetical protein [Cytobacillus firmus]
MKLNDRVQISFDFTGEKGTAECYIFKFIEISFKLEDYLSFPEYSEVSQQLYETLRNHVEIENYHLGSDEISFVTSMGGTGFDFLEEMEQAVNETVTEIVSFLGSIQYPFYINLVIDGIY